MQKYSRILITVLFVGLVSNVIAAPNSDDIRILIDVSGSMKINDPLDHRISALKLFNGLISDGSKAGVWTIDRYVDMAVKWGTVNDEWREAADTGTSTIHSSGLRRTVRVSSRNGSAVTIRNPSRKSNGYRVNC